MKVLKTTSGFPAWDLTKGLGIPRESEGQRGLIIGLPQDWGKQRLQSWRAQIKSCMHQDPEERSSDPTAEPVQETKPKLCASVEGFPVEAWVGRGLPQGQGHWQQQSWKFPFGVSPLRSHQ